jgi:hypothetical protein
MSHARHSDKRDRNEAAIVARYRALGCRVVPQGRGAGFDLLVLWPGGFMQLVEVKNPDTRWQYTESETDLLVWCAENGGHYVTVCYPFDVVAPGEVSEAERVAIVEGVAG